MLAARQTVSEVHMSLMLHAYAGLQLIRWQPKESTVSLGWPHRRHKKQTGTASNNRPESASIHHWGAHDLGLCHLAAGLEACLAASG